MRDFQHLNSNNFGRFISPKIRSLVLIFKILVLTHCDEDVTRKDKERCNKVLARRNKQGAQQAARCKQEVARG